MRVTAALLFVLTAASAATAQVIPSDANRRTARDHYWNGQDWLSMERWDKAADEFSAAIGLNPLLTDAYYGLGQANMALKRYVSAARAFEGCLAAARNVHALRERARMEKDQQISEEVDEVRDTIRRRRDSSLRSRQLDGYIDTLLRNRSSIGLPFEPPAPVLLALGSAHFRNGDRIRAEYYWREAARIDRGLGEAWNNLAVIYATSARGELAAEAVGNAERAGFHVNPQLKDDIARLQQ